MTIEHRDVRIKVELNMYRPLIIRSSLYAFNKSAVYAVNNVRKRNGDIFPLYKKRKTPSAQLICIPSMQFTFYACEIRHCFARCQRGGCDEM